MVSPTLYSYEKYSFRIITPLLALISLVFLFNGGYTGASISVVLGVLLAFSYQGVIIDPLQMRYMKYDRFLNFRIGGWKPLSMPSYVTVVRIKLSSDRTSPAPFVMPEGKKSARTYKVNLVVEGDERYIGICRGTLEKMTGEALKLGKSLQVRVLDYTTSDKKWLL
jgi:hypothetical protein